MSAFNKWGTYPKPKLDTSERDNFEAEFYKKFGILVQQRRNEMALTAERLAALVNTTRGTIYNVETGKSYCSFLLGLKISRILKIDFSTLATEAVADLSNMVNQ